MGQIKNSVVLEKALRADFMKSFDNGENPSDVNGMIMQTSSSSSSEKYGWLGNVPQLTEWKDSRKLQGVLDFDYTIANTHYEATLQVDRDDIEDDQLGGIKVRINDLAKRAKTHPRKLFFDKLVAGTVDLCFDGLPFFSNSHVYKVGGATQDNLHTGTKVGAYPTVAELQLDFGLMRAIVRGFTDDQGEPFNEGELQFTIVAGVNLENALDAAFKADLIGNNTNLYKGAAKYMTTSRVSGADWYLLETSGSLKPMIQQNRQAPQFDALERTSESGFMSKLYKYGIDYRVGFGYGLWQKAIKCQY